MAAEARFRLPELDLERFEAIRFEPGKDPGVVVAERLATADGTRSRKNRRVRLKGICEALDLPVETAGHLRYQLLHRTWSALDAAAGHGDATAALVVLSFLPDHTVGGSGWDDFAAFAAALDPSSPAPVPGTPWYAGKRRGIDLWLVWVSDQGGRQR